MIVEIGNKFGKLTVIDLVVKHDNRQKRRYAQCQCDCGSQPILVRIDSLCKPDTSSRGPARSCGCLQREKVTKHGVWNHPLYRVWKSMMERCYDQNSDRYYRYGKRGIIVCDNWHDVHNFIAEMSNGYQAHLQIDRIDNDKGYSKENCRWATRLEQAQSRSNTIAITFNGKTMSMKQWAKHIGITYGTLVERIRVLNWPIEKALTEPPRQGRYNPWNKKS